MSKAKASQIETVEREITEGLVNSFSLLSGDVNPIHTDEEAAAESRFGERIAHGMLVASFISTALSKLDGEVIYLSQDLSFNKPVMLGDTVTAEVVTYDEPAGKTRVSTVVLNQDDEEVINGEAVVLINQDGDE